MSFDSDVAVLSDDMSRSNCNKLALFMARRLKERAERRKRLGTGKKASKWEFPTFFFGGRFVARPLLVVWLSVSLA